MSTDSLSTFETAVPGTVHRTAAADASEALAEAIEPPAIGTAIPHDGVSLPDSVETDLSPSDLESAATGVTPAALGIAEYGTVTIPSGAAGDELVSLYTPRHVAVVAASDVVPDMAAAYERLSEDFAAGADTQILSTGPSATADMGTLVQGVHGPSETHVVLLEDR
ncbi:LUD domain-containing protein [Halorientalis halophila]|uniref:LUD domain-containing protein n=1 Tax=Halorientalis halophila TaxID=3108499 RepID=UPI00300AFF19